MMLSGQNTFFSSRILSFSRTPRPAADCRMLLCCQQTLGYYRDVKVGPFSAAPGTTRLQIAPKAPGARASLTEDLHLALGIGHFTQSSLLLNGIGQVAKSCILKRTLALELMRQASAPSSRRCPYTGQLSSSDDAAHAFPQPSPLPRPLGFASSINPGE